MMLLTVMMVVLLVKMMMIMLVMMGTESHSIFFSITPLLGVNGYSGHDDMEINFSIIRCQSVKKHGGYEKDGGDEDD